MKELKGFTESFYVLEYADTPGCYELDNQIMITDNIKAATRYDDKKFAEKLAKNSKGKYVVKKVTILYTIDDID